MCVTSIRHSVRDDFFFWYNRSFRFIFTIFAVCRLMVTEIQRKLKIFGKVKTITNEGGPVYYKELVL